MSLRPSGFWCDVCNSPMAMEMLLNTPIKSFKLSCSPSEMHFHDKCEPLIKPAVELLDTEKLPSDSPLGDIIRRVIAHNAKLDGRAAMGGDIK